MQRLLLVLALAVFVASAAPPVFAACTYSAHLYGTPPTAAIGQDITFNAYAEGFNGCSASGTNRRFSIDYDGNGTYDCVTPWTGCYNSPCKKWCHTSYSTPGTHTPKAKIEWANNSNGTVVEYASTTITVNAPCTFTPVLAASPASTETGQAVTFDAGIASWANCSTAGANRRYLIDYDGNGSYDCVTPWTGCWTSACKQTCQHSYGSPATYNAQVRLEWANNSNGTVVQYATTPVTISGDTTPPANPATFTATIDGKNASGLWINVANPTLELTWSAASDPPPGSGVAGYQLVLQRASDGAWLYSPQLGAVTSHSLATGGLAHGKTYHYWIRAQDGAGNWAGFKLGGSFSVDTVLPAQDSLTVSSPVWQVDGTSAYDITLKATDAHSGPRLMYALINLQGANSPNRRGYFAWNEIYYTWGANAADKIACAGGGYASKYAGPSGAPPGYGRDFSTLIGCSMSFTGGQRTVTFTVRPHVDFGDFSNNDVSFWTRDAALNVNGWINYDLDFQSVFVDIVPPDQQELTVSAMDWYANGRETYDVTVTAADPDSGVRELRALINLQGANNANRRGYLSWREDTYTWGAAASTDRIECTGGGYADKYDGAGGTPVGYGKDFVSLVGCSTAVEDGTRSVTFTLMPHEDFGTFDNNDISSWSRDHALNISGWQNHDLDYGSTDSTSPASSLRLIVQDNLWFGDRTPNNPDDCNGANYCIGPTGSCQTMIPVDPLLGCTKSSDQHVKAQEIQWLQRYTGRDGSGLVISQEWIKPHKPDYHACSEDGRPPGNPTDSPSDLISQNLDSFTEVLDKFGGQTLWNIFYDPILAARQRCFIGKEEIPDFAQPDVDTMWDQDMIHLWKEAFTDPMYWQVGSKPVLYVWNAYGGLVNQDLAFGKARSGNLSQPRDPVYILGDVQACGAGYPGNLPQQMDGATGFLVLAPGCNFWPWVDNTRTNELEPMYNSLANVPGLDFMPASSAEYDDTEFTLARGLPASEAKRTLARDVAEVRRMLASSESFALSNPVAGVGYVFWGTSNNWAEGTTLLPTQPAPPGERYAHPRTPGGPARIGNYGFTKLEAVRDELFPNVPAYAGPQVDLVSGPTETGGAPAGSRRFEVVVEFSDCDYLGELRVEASGGATVLNEPDWRPPARRTPPSNAGGKFSKLHLERMSEFRYRWRGEIDVVDGASQASVIVTFVNLDGQPPAQKELLDNLPQPMPECSPRRAACAEPDSPADGDDGCCNQLDFCNASGICRKCKADGTSGCSPANQSYYCCSGVCTDGDCGIPQCLEDGAACDSAGDGSECCGGECYHDRCGPPVLCRGQIVTILGTSGDDRGPLLGTDQEDVIAGLGGDDIIHGLEGDDVICGGGGEDEILGGPGDDKIEGGAGDDEIYGNEGRDELFGNGGNDLIFGGKGADLITGGAGADELDGGTSADILRGKGGRDLIRGGGGHDTLYGGKKRDRLVGEGGNDDLTGGKGNDVCIDVEAGTDFDESCEEVCFDETSCPP